jgi:hypothetical protein
MSGRSSTPHKVVRFYGNTDFALEAAAGRQVTLVHVSKLNDPFDPYFFFETDFENDYDRLLSYVRNRSSKDSGWFQSHVPRERWQQSIDSVEAHVKSYRDSTFVLSCSAVSKDSHPKDNLYLWGHYGLDREALQSSSRRRRQFPSSSTIISEAKTWISKTLG